jgi:iron complex transport system ATP-binding protein
MVMRIEVNGVACMAAGRQILAPMSARFEAGRFCAILGPNGAGKSTLLGVLSAQRRPHQGDVRMNGDLLGARPVTDLARMRAVMPQEAAVAFDYTVEDIVALGRFPHRRCPAEDEAGIVRRAMAATQVTHLAGRVHNTLSGGEKARAHLARVLAQVWEPLPDGQVRWLLLDEPTAALDLAHQHAVLQTVRDWACTQGVGVVAVLHDINLALRYADDAVVLEAGTAVHSGAVHEVLTPNLIGRVWGIGCHAAEGQVGGALQYVFTPH